MTKTISQAAKRKPTPHPKRATKKPSQALQKKVERRVFDKLEEDICSPYYSCSYDECCSESLSCYSQPDEIMSCHSRSRSPSPRHSRSASSSRSESPCNSVLNAEEEQEVEMITEEVVKNVARQAKSKIQQKKATNNRQQKSQNA